MLYRVRVGRDEYLGTAEEVVAFMMRAEGAPGRDPASYMAGVARRLEERLGVRGVSSADPTSFLLSLGERRVVEVEPAQEPTAERVDPQTALGEGPVIYGEGVDPDDLPE